MVKWIVKYNFLCPILYILDSLVMRYVGKGSSSVDMKSELLQMQVKQKADEEQKSNKDLMDTGNLKEHVFSEELPAIAPLEMRDNLENLDEIEEGDITEDQSVRSCPTKSLVFIKDDDLETYKKLTERGHTLILVGKDTINQDTLYVKQQYLSIFPKDFTERDMNSEDPLALPTEHTQAETYI